ncbi:MAG: hypothetical protein KJ592_04160 [Nanoarchaeota archaeon]|nr:hypothetical protein [Nanoarchaeota archaeon]
MEYGGADKRRTKKDLKRKRLARGYKRGGQHRVSEVGSRVSEDEGKEKKVRKKVGKKKGK